MVMRGRVKNGKILLAAPKGLAEGTEVEVRLVKRPRKAHKPVRTRKKPRSLAERLAPIIGIAKNLPADMSVNVDHYVYGLPKKK